MFRAHDEIKFGLDEAVEILMAAAKKKWSDLPEDAQVSIGFHIDDENHEHIVIASDDFDFGTD